MGGTEIGVSNQTKCVISLELSSRLFRGSTDRVDVGGRSQCGTPGRNILGRWRLLVYTFIWFGRFLQSRLSSHLCVVRMLIHAILPFGVGVVLRRLQASLIMWLWALCVSPPRSLWRERRLVYVGLHCNKSCGVKRVCAECCSYSGCCFNSTFVFFFLYGWYIGMLAMCILDTQTDMDPLLHYLPYHTRFSLSRLITANNSIMHTCIRTFKLWLIRTSHQYMINMNNASCN
jgi:hypothetical protein